MIIIFSICILQLDNFALDKKTIITKEAEGYQVNRVVSQGEKVERSAHTFPLEVMKGFISEGSNLLLLRLMVIKGLPAGFQAISFDSDGNLCRSPYVSLYIYIICQEQTFPNHGMAHLTIK